MPSLFLIALAVAAPAGGEIIVTGRALPPPLGAAAYATVTLPRDRLVGTASGRLEAALGEVAGFQQFRRSDSRSANPSAQGVTLRALGGNAASRALLLLDGVPMGDPFFGSVPFAALAPERLAEVRVTRGGGVGAFGAGALAGTVELISAGGTELPAFGLGYAQASVGDYEAQGSARLNFKGGFAALSARRDAGDGFETTPVDQRVAATASAAHRGWSAHGRSVVALGRDLELQLGGLAWRDARTLRFAGADSLTLGQDASIRLLGRGAWQFDALAYGQRRNFRNIVISATTFRRSLDQKDTPAHGVGGKLELRPPVGGGHVLRLGVDARHVAGEMAEDAYNATTGAVTARRKGGGAQDNMGLFIEDDVPLGPVTLTGGVRVDRWSLSGGFFETRNAIGALVGESRFADRAGWQPSMRMGLLAPLGEAAKIRLAGYTGFRLPTLNELYRPFVVFPITTEANAALDPEHLQGVELGLDLAPTQGLSLGVTLFDNRLEDAIANVTTGPNLRQRRNVPAIRARGVELMGSLRRGAMSVDASYTYSDARVRAPGQAFDGHAPAQAPRHAASLGASWSPAGGPRLSATLRYVGAQAEDDLGVDRLPDALTLDGAARFALGRGVALTLRGENLFDAEVMTRKVGSSIDLGAPRTVWVGLSFGG